jgi:hypothetical protein
VSKQAVPLQSFRFKPSQLPIIIIGKELMCYAIKLTCIYLMACYEEQFIYWGKAIAVGL